MKVLRYFNQPGILLLTILLLGPLAGCQGDLDHLTHVKGKAELIVSSKIRPAAYKFSPDMAKVIFNFSEDGKTKQWGLINLEGSRRLIELFTECQCGVQNVMWLNDTFFVSNGRCAQCDFLIDSYDLTMTPLSFTMVRAIEDELIATWKAADPLYYLPHFGNQNGWLLILDDAAPHYYSLGLGDDNLKALLAALGDAPIVIERKEHGPKVYSPDGTMYAKHGSTGAPVRIYSRDGELLAEARPPRSDATIGVLGWTSDGGGGYCDVSSPALGPESLFLLRLP